jgi:hypothetical protein
MGAVWTEATRSPNLTPAALSWRVEPQKIQTVQPGAIVDNKRVSRAGDGQGAAGGIRGKPPAWPCRAAAPAE